MKYLVLLLLLFSCSEAEQDRQIDATPPIVGLSLPDLDASLDAEVDQSPPPTIWDARPPQPDQEVDAEIVCQPLFHSEPCNIPELEGVCSQGERTCHRTHWGQCSQIVNPRREVCNGLDDDCNGFVDDNPLDPTGETPLQRACYTGELSTLKVGLCMGGISYCAEIQEETDAGISSSYSYLGCTGEYTPQDEICDNLDNDCDGISDEGVTNACGACGELPEEVCDGLDNDCNGSIDEGLLNACGQCGPLQDELCDFLDNDCDGIVDEDAGNCECGNPLYVPQPEICNGIDEDCDARIDEGIDGGPLTLLCSTDSLNGQIMTYERREDGPQYIGGNCRLGLSFCQSQRNDEGDFEYGYFECLQEVLPNVERCNGVDDDCDGEADEGFEAANVAVLMVIDISGSMQDDELAAAFDQTVQTVNQIHNNGPANICYMLAIIGSDSFPDPYLFAPAHNCVPGIEDPLNPPVEDLQSSIAELRRLLRLGALNQGGATENSYDAIGRFFTDDLIDWDNDGIPDNVTWDTSDPMLPQHSPDLSLYTHRIIVILGDEEGQGEEWDEHSAFRAMAQSSGMLFIIGPSDQTPTGERVRESYRQLIDIGAVYRGMGIVRHDNDGEGEQEVADGIREALEEADCINGQQQEP